jgi:hypothetical protein
VTEPDVGPGRGDEQDEWSVAAGCHVRPRTLRGMCQSHVPPARP